MCTVLGLALAASLIAHLARSFKNIKPEEEEFKQYSRYC